MQTGDFSRSVVVKEWHARHCFISLPRHWASVILSTLTPTFCLETSQGRNVLLSWAGDVHNPSIGNENMILVNRELLKDTGISDGEVGVLTQVPVPPPCTKVTVTVGSLAQWQDLALNAEVAQSAILSQVRVISQRQSVPLWLEGGAYVTLMVNSLDPPLRYGILQPMTQMEVLPPSENNETHDNTSITFTPANSGDFDSDQQKMVESDQDCHKELEQDFRSDEKIQGGKEPRGKNISNDTDYMSDKFKGQKLKCGSPVQREIRLGYRVVSVPIQNTLHFELLSHPSLVIISKESLLHTSYKNKVSFIASLKKINSPKENFELSNALKDETKSSELKKQNIKKNNELNSPFLCTVIVWENLDKEKKINSDCVKKIDAIVKVNNCVIPNCLRRLMKLNTLSVVELQTFKTDVRTVPVSLDMLPLVPVEDSNATLLNERVKVLLRNLANEFPVIINQNTLLEVILDKKCFDVFITTRDGVPLKLTEKSVVLLELTLLKQLSDVPYIHRTVSDLNNYHGAFSYVGNEDVFLELKQHVLLGQGNLNDGCNVVPQFALLHGSKGAGKTSLAQSLIEGLSSYPYFMHSEIVSFKLLKGKKMEAVEKKLQLIFKEAIFKRPSIIVLDDIDHLVPSQGSFDQDSGPMYEHLMQMVFMLKGLLDQLLEFLSDSDFPLHLEKPACGSVMVIATCIVRTSVHPLLVNPQGCHYFPCTFGIPPLGPEGRLKALKIMLKAYIEKYKLRRRLISEHNFRSLQDPVDDTVCETDKDSCSQYLQVDEKMISRRTENFALPDLNHLALRTFFQAKHRWECNVTKKSDAENKILYKHIIKKPYIPSTACFRDVSSEDSSLDSEAIINCDIEAALEGYTPLALRGLTLSEKKNAIPVRIGGLVEACSILEETLTWPSVYPNLFSKVKLRLRSGVLLYGPPGCGKTLLANSVTANCQLNFISVKGPELLSKYIGASEEAVRDAFERASSAKPCVLFFDEFESIAPRRGHDSTGVTDRVVNQLLTQMDGVEGLSGVYVLAATSRPDLIDPALLRPGRLDKCVFCPMPSVSDRKEILEVLSEDMDLGEDIDWGEVASTTENFTGADLQSLLSTAQILVAQEALGDKLYEDVIPSDQSQGKWEQTDASYTYSEKTVLIESDDAFDLCDDSTILETDGACSRNILQEEIIIEKEIEKVTYSPKRASLKEDNLYVGTTKEENTNIKVSHVGGTKIDDSSKSDVCVHDPTEKPEFRVFKRHIVAALKDVKPSVTLADRQRYENLYATFTKSRDGGFGQPSPGKRATLA
ncbi:LOW QUALITY PROTEIN: peroxisomal ATPase PEX1-like [Panulirus ornatus]|uniref:LOW QUALITY PROTEIN: peroxisomal ATPase PEX1-like n=1 Tax=Panulirus ornatus TaxID=150431 RepID=UPI003A84C9DB